MTDLYEWSPMPHSVHVPCVACRGRARFEFVETVQIRRADHEFFESSSQFEIQFFEDGGGRRWHGACFYAGLHGGGTGAIHSLPPGYNASDWDHSKYLSNRQGWPMGSVVCENCGRREKSRVEWPQDAYYHVEYRGKMLWAFHAESALELRDFLMSDERNYEKYTWAYMLRHVPSEFKSKKARNYLVRKLDRLLKASRAAPLPGFS